MIIERVRHDGTVSRKHVILWPIRSIDIYPNYQTIHNLLGPGYDISVRIFFEDRNKPQACYCYSHTEWENQGGE